MLHNISQSYCLLHDSNYEQLPLLCYLCDENQIRTSLVIYGDGNKLPSNMYSTHLDNELDIYNICFARFIDNPDNSTIFITNHKIFFNLSEYDKILEFFNDRDWDIILFTSSKTGSSTCNSNIFRMYEVSDIQGIITTRDIVETLIHRNNIIESINSMIPHVNVFGIQYNEIIN